MNRRLSSIFSPLRLWQIAVKRAKLITVLKLTRWTVQYLPFRIEGNQESTRSLIGKETPQEYYRHDETRLESRELRTLWVSKIVAGTVSCGLVQRYGRYTRCKCSILPNIFPICFLLFFKFMHNIKLIERWKSEK